MQFLLNQQVFDWYRRILSQQKQSWRSFWKAKEFPTSMALRQSLQTSAKRHWNEDTLAVLASCIWLFHGSLCISVVTCFARSICMCSLLLQVPVNKLGVNMLDVFVLLAFTMASIHVTCKAIVLQSLFTILSKPVPDMQVHAASGVCYRQASLRICCCWSCHESSWKSC